MFKVGNIVQDVSGNQYEITRIIGDEYEVKGYNGHYTLSNCTLIKSNERNNMLKELTTDVKGFIKDNRSVIYTIAAVMLVDHFVFGGAFRDRLKSMVEKLLSKAEAKIDTVK